MRRDELQWDELIEPVKPEEEEEEEEEEAQGEVAESAKPESEREKQNGLTGKTKTSERSGSVSSK